MVLDRKLMSELVIKLQRQHCDYDMFRIKPNATPPSFCDCKYGFDGKKNGEQNGCPELRELSYLLSMMTDVEYKEIMSRTSKVS